MANLDIDDVRLYNQRLAETRVTTADRLRQIMSERGIKQADIVRMCEPYAAKCRTRIGRNDLSQYLSGKCEPGQLKLYVLGKALNVNEVWLMGFDVDRAPRVENEALDLVKNTAARIQSKKVPMLGDIACGSPIVANQEYETYVLASDNIDADFCVTAKGDSMINARIFSGDIVFIKSQPTVENGEIAAILIDDEVTLKRVYLYEGRIELRPENPTYPVLNFEGEHLNGIRIIGKAVAFQGIIK